ncbi:MAG TPA: hypothetical protein VK908_03225 [Jiangellales bacterium]|nr:hypothetical protein [Jiangellales bacterium]
MTAVVTGRGVHGPGLLARVAVVVNPFPVSSLDYRVDAEGAVTFHLTVTGPPAAGERVAARLRRVVGLTAVVLAVDSGAPSLATMTP